MGIDICSIGGYEEVGKNCTAINVDGDVVIIDMGLHLDKYIPYRESEDIIVDVDEMIRIGAVPNLNSIKDWLPHVKAIIPAHAHLDHAGAIPFLSNRINAPIICTPFTKEIISAMAFDEKIKMKNPIKVLNANSKINLTDKIKIESKSKSETQSKTQKVDEIKETWPSKIKAMVIVELMGAPQEHIKNTMQLYLEKIAESDVMIVDEKYISELEKKDSFFLQFAEITITFKSVKGLIEFCFDYMPSSIEIIEPEAVTYNSHDLSTIVNDLQAKLHQLDMIVKNLRAENKIINENGNLLLRNLVLVALKEEMELKELAEITGINEDALENYLLDYVATNLVEEKNGKYKAKKTKK